MCIYTGDVKCISDIIFVAMRRFKSDDISRCVSDEQATIIIPKIVKK